MARASSRTRLANRFGVALAVVVVVGFVLRLVYVLGFARHIELGVDSTWYELQAGQLAEGNGYVNIHALFSRGVVEPTAYWPPLYPAFLAVVTKVAGGSQLDHQVAGALMGTVTVGLTGLLGRRVLGPAVGIVAAAIVAGHPHLVAADGAVMSETLYLPLALVASLLLVGAWTRPTTVRCLVLGVVFGAAVLTRLDALIAAGLVGLGFLLVRPAASRLRERLAPAALIAAGIVVVVAPWVVRNWVRLDEPTVATVSTTATIAGANCDSTWYGPNLGSWDFGCMDAERLEADGEVEWSRETRAAGFRYVRGHLDRLPVVAAVRVLRVWGLYDPDDQALREAVESRRYRFQLLGWAVQLPVLALAVGGTAVVRRRHRDVPLFPLAVMPAAVTVTALTGYGNQRFALVAAPALAVLAACCLMALGRRIARGYLEVRS